MFITNLFLEFKKEEVLLCNVMWLMFSYVLISLMR